MKTEHAFRLIEDQIIQRLSDLGGRATWTEVMEPLGLLGPCEPNDSMKGYASGFFVERMKEQGRIHVHQVAPRHRKILISNIHPDWTNELIRKI